MGETNGEPHSPSSSPVEDLSGVTWKENSRCRAIYNADGQAYEATLKEIYPKSGEGKIHFIGMNVNQVMPLKELQKVILLVLYFTLVRSSMSLGCSFASEFGQRSQRRTT